MSRELEKIAELGITFRLVPAPGRDMTFELKIEANVMGTDDVVMDRRHAWTFGYVRKTKSGVFLSFDQASPRHRRMRVYTEYRSRGARDAIKKVADRIADIVAPKHRREVRSLDAPVEMFEEIHRQLAVYIVLET